MRLFGKDLCWISEHYTKLVEKYGDTPTSSQWTDLATQEKRMNILLEIGDIKSSKVLDFGCGTGHLLEVMKGKYEFNGEYVGYDISRKMIEIAREKHPLARFEHRNILEEGVPEDFDYIFISGVFNNRASDNWGMMTSILKCLFNNTRKAIAFNNLSTYVDYVTKALFHVDPERVFRFCKEELSPFVTLRHDYEVKPGVVPFEFSVYVYKTEIPTIKRMSN